MQLSPEPQGPSDAKEGKFACFVLDGFHLSLHNHWNHCSRSIEKATCLLFILIENFGHRGNAYYEKSQGNNNSEKKQI